METVMKLINIINIEIFGGPKEMYLLEFSRFSMPIQWFLLYIRFLC